MKVSRRMGGGGGKRWGEVGWRTIFWNGKLKEGYQTEDLGIVEKIILKLISLHIR